MARSILAVITGYVATAAAVFLSFALLFPEALPERQPGIAVMLLLVVAGTIYAVMGGYVAALVAGRAELAHGIALAALMATLGLVNLGMHMGEQPLWYLASLPVTGAAGAVIGSWLRARRVERESWGHAEVVPRQ